jgi:hypothetical protein
VSLRDPIAHAVEKIALNQGFVENEIKLTTACAREGVTEARTLSTNKLRRCHVQMQRATDSDAILTEHHAKGAHS